MIRDRDAEPRGDSRSRVAFGATFADAIRDTTFADAALGVRTEWTDRARTDDTVPD